MESPVPPSPPSLFSLDEDVDFEADAERVLSKHLDDLEQTLHYEIRAHLQPHDQTGAVLTDAQYARQHARLIGRGNQRARNPINRTAAETTNDSDPDTDDGQTADDVDDNEDSEQSRQQQAPQRRRIPVRESINLRDSQRGATKSIRTTGNNRPRQPVVYPEHLPPEHLRPAPIEEDAEIGEFEPFEVEVDEPQKTEQEEAVEDCLRWRTVFTHLRVNGVPLLPTMGSRGSLGSGAASGAMSIFPSRRGSPFVPRSAQKHLGSPLSPSSASHRAQISSQQSMHHRGGRESRDSHRSSRESHFSPSLSRQRMPQSASAHRRQEMRFSPPTRASSGMSRLHGRHFGESSSPLEATLEHIDASEEIDEEARASAWAELSLVGRPVNFLNPATPLLGTSPPPLRSQHSRVIELPASPPAFPPSRSVTSPLAAQIEAETLLSDGVYEEILAFDESSAVTTSFAQMQRVLTRRGARHTERSVGPAHPDALTADQIQRRRKEVLTGAPPLTPERYIAFEESAIALDSEWKALVCPLLVPLLELAVSQICREADLKRQEQIAYRDQQQQRQAGTDTFSPEPLPPPLLSRQGTELSMMNVITPTPEPLHHSDGNYLSPILSEYRPPDLKPSLLSLSARRGESDAEKPSASIHVPAIATGPFALSIAGVSIAGKNFSARGHAPDEPMDSVRLHAQFVSAAVGVHRVRHGPDDDTSAIAVSGTKLKSSVPVRNHHPENNAEMNDHTNTGEEVPLKDASAANAVNVRRRMGNNIPTQAPLVAAMSVAHANLVRRASTKMNERAMVGNGPAAVAASALSALNLDDDLHDRAAMTLPVGRVNAVAPVGHGAQSSRSALADDDAVGGHGKYSHMSHSISDAQSLLVAAGPPSMAHPDADHDDSIVQPTLVPVQPQRKAVSKLVMGHVRGSAAAIKAAAAVRRQALFNQSLDSLSVQATRIGHDANEMAARAHPHLPPQPPAASKSRRDISQRVHNQRLLLDPQAPPPADRDASGFYRSTSEPRSILQLDAEISNEPHFDDDYASPPIGEATNSFFTSVHEQNLDAIDAELFASSGHWNGMGAPQPLKGAKTRSLSHIAAPRAAPPVGSVRAAPPPPPQQRYRDDSVPASLRSSSITGSISALTKRGQPPVPPPRHRASIDGGPAPLLVGMPPTANDWLQALVDSHPVPGKSRRRLVGGEDNAEQRALPPRGPPAASNSNSSSVLRMAGSTLLLGLGSHQPSAQVATHQRTKTYPAKDVLLSSLDRPSTADTGPKLTDALLRPISATRSARGVLTSTLRASSPVVDADSGARAKMRLQPSQR